MKDKFLFDNNQNDWLKKEQIRESKISAWDLDDSAKSLRQMHNDNCDREEVYEEHHERCSINDFSQNHYQESIKEENEGLREIMLERTKERIKNSFDKSKYESPAVIGFGMIILIMFIVELLISWF